MAIRWREHDGFGGDIAAGPGAVLDDEWLAEPVGQPLSEKPRKDVGRTTRCKADDDAHRPRRIGLRPSEARDGREHRRHLQDLIEESVDARDERGTHGSRGRIPQRGGEASPG
jgi:hypothetical protein